MSVVWNARLRAATKSAVVVHVHNGETDSEVLTDNLAQEVPVALVYNGISHAVMMATPVDLEDFARGFSISEGILESPAELYEIDLRTTELGIEVEMQIATQRLVELKDRRRNLVGRTGCGICGAESLTEAMRLTDRAVSAPSISAAAIQRAAMQLCRYQPLQAVTGAMHAAAWCDLSGDIIVAREDVGRHNALDKLIGALLVRSEELHRGFALVSSRASYEMVQKSCCVGIGALVSVSAATALAVERARQAGQLLVGFVRSGRHVIYHQPVKPPVEEEADHDAGSSR